MAARMGQRPPRMFKAPTPEQAQADNDRRLRAVRAHYGHIRLRLVPQVRIHHTDALAWRPKMPATVRKQPSGFKNWGVLRGTGISLRLDEAIDAYDLLSDLRRFLLAWRPWRARTDPNRAAARACLETWERLGRG